MWLFAANLIRALHKKGFQFTEKKLEQLIIACFFHDTGLTRTLDASHGRESREICRDYLAEHSSFSADSMTDILNAVEKHDDKTYKDLTLSAYIPMVDLTTLLSVCDDLDAFGAIGVFRYLEIYLQRGMTIHSMPAEITGNLEKRFGNLVRCYGELKDFIQIQQKRYQYTVDFYNELKRQWSVHDANAHEGPLKVADLLVDKVLHGKIHFTELIPHTENLPLDPYGKSYFKQLQNELSGKY